MKYKAGGHYEGELLHGLREGLVPWGSGGRSTNVVCLNLEAPSKEVSLFQSATAMVCPDPLSQGPSDSKGLSQSLPLWSAS